MIRSLKQRVLTYKKQKRYYFAQESRGRPIYEMYFFSGRKKWISILISCILVLFFSYFFYQNFWFVIPLSPMGFYFYLRRQKAHAHKRRQQFEEEFKDLLLYLAANLRAGYSVENAFLECKKDMEKLHGQNSLICSELQKLQKELSYNQSLQEFLLELGGRSGVDSVRKFGDIFAVARKNGGNMPEVIQNTAMQITEEISLKQEIAVTISGKVLEQRIMNVLPFALYYYILLGNPHFFDGLYGNLGGILIMTLCLILYVLAYFLSQKIMRAVE